ncbi:MAG: peptidase T [Bacilli bacterium]|nr:peptidase T [Bacilli bacterium]
MENVERFIRYAKVDTQANDRTGTTPSTEKQKNLSKLLVSELKEMGIDNAYMDEYGIVYAHVSGEGERIGLNAHIDTALEVTDTNVNPRIVKNYDGKPLKLNEKYTLTTEDFPQLKNHIGKDLVVTDGNTLLGADDKAGIAIIMSAVEYFMKHPEVKHHPISIAFTVDEEIGEGTDHFSLDKMQADYGFTLDGADIDCIDYENFNAQGVKLNIQGVAVHPGEGKNALVNALVLINEFVSALPANETPFDANEDEGYWHINNINGTSESATLEMILRDFDREKLNQRDIQIKEIVKNLQAKWPKAKIELSIEEQYENMKPYVDKDPRPVQVAMDAMKRMGITPRSTKIRGGTDGATMSKMGLVTPNLGTGSANHHGRYEYLVIQDFEKMIELVKEILKY